MPTAAIENTIESAPRPRPSTSSARPGSGTVLRIDDLHVGFTTRGHHAEVVKGVSLRLEAGRCLAIVGESGSGKSVIARSIIGLAGDNSRVQAGTLEVGGRDVRGFSDRRFRELRGTHVGFVLQDALVSLDPLRPISKEVGDALRLHSKLGAKERHTAVLDLLASVGIPEPGQRAQQRSGELSGGLRQRALIASAIALDPPLLIADEPTTALDATVQKQILDLILELKKKGTAILLISHDLAVVSHLADAIAIINQGVIVESGPTGEVLRNPQNDYTRQLMQAVVADKPRGTRLSPSPTQLSQRQVRVVEARRSTAVDADHAAVVVARDLAKRYVKPDGSPLVALQDVSFTLNRGETLGIVGESGSGKTTAARAVLGVVTPDSGSIELLGLPWSDLSEKERRPFRKRLGAVYQDPLGSFDPRMTVREILVEALSEGRTLRDKSLDSEVSELLDMVGLPNRIIDRLPLRLSGGQRQRVAIARALAPGPEVLVCDEPVSALDVSVQAQVLDLLDELQRNLGLSLLFISHDLGVIQHVSDRVLVMRQGRVVETGTSRQVFEQPQHAYTAALIAASPRL